MGKDYVIFDGPVFEYKSVPYCFARNSNNIIDYYVNGKLFFKRDDMERYIDKVILRRKKLERLKVI